MKKIRKIVWGLFFAAAIICFSKQPAAAKDALKPGDTFYTDSIKCRVLTPSTEWKTYSGEKSGSGGTVEVIGANSDSMFNDRVEINSYATCEETHERFDVVSVGKNAFKNNKQITYIVFEKPLGLDYSKPIKLAPNCIRNCPNLSEITFWNSAVVSKKAISNCPSLDEITVSSEANITLKKGAFKGIKCVNLTINHLRNSADSKVAKAFAKKLKKAGVKKIIYYYYNRYKTLK